MNRVFYSGQMYYNNRLLKIGRQKVLQRTANRQPAAVNGAGFSFTV